MSNPRRKLKKEKLEWPYVTFSASRNAWQADSRTKTGGSRKFFKTKGEAETYAAQCRITRNNQGTDAFGNEDLARFGKSVQWAIEYALEHLRAVQKSVSVDKAMKELVAAKKAAGRSEQYCKDLENRLSRFQKGFPSSTLATITTAEIDFWLVGLPVAPGTRNTFRRDIRTLYSFAEKRGYCQASVAKNTERATSEDKPPGILTPAEASAILCACNNDIVPYTAISLLAGLRAAEVGKLDWSELDFEGGHIEVTAAKSKTRRRRLVPIADNLRAWLKDHVKKAGPVIPANLRRKLDESRRMVGFGTPGTETEEEKRRGVKLKEWSSNAMRHSFASYRLAQCQDAAKVALEMGNSPAIVFGHYRELVKPKDAEKYWAIMPAKDDGKVVAFEESAA